MEADRIVFETHDVSDVNSGRPSLIRYSPALVLLIIAIVDIQRWADPDLWGHVAFGRAMLATYHLTFHDPYSYSAPGHLWLNHEWLSELALASAYDFGGVVGLKLMKFACSAVVVVSLGFALAETDTPIVLQLTILLLAAVALAPQMQFRPQLFTFVMISALSALLTKYTYRGRVRRLFVAIPMLGLWANLHGGFVVGLAALATFTAVRTTTDLLGGRGPWVGAKLLAILTASTLVTIVTPYGFGTWRAVITAMTNPYTREVIVDWQPLARAFLATWHENHVASIPIIAAITMFLILAMMLVLNSRCGDSALVAVALVFIAAAVFAMRNLPLAVITTVIVLGRRAGAFWSDARSSRPAPISQGVFAAIGISILIGSGLLSDRLRAGDPRPVGAIGFMTANHLSGNIMSDFGWGEYVIWHTAPASKVFIDGRYDTVYPASVIDDYLKFRSRPTRDFLEKYPHDFVLLGRDDKREMEFVFTAQDWRALYRDGTCSLFARTTSTAVRTRPLVVPSEQTPASFFP